MARVVEITSSAKRLLSRSTRSVLLACMGVVLFVGAAQAEQVTNRQFLKLSEGQRHWWYVGTYTTLGHVVFLEDQEKGKCVWNWLFSDYERREALLMKSFKQYPDHSPSSIVIALLRRDCGVFPEKK